jgi:hypothetical protein
VSAERKFQVRHVVFDPQRYDRLCAGLATELTRLGQPMTRLEVEAALSQARTIADRSWAGQTRLDLIPLIERVPHAIAVRLAGISVLPPKDLATRYEDTGAALPGLGLQVDLGRSYPFTASASHLIGSIRRSEDPEEPGSFNWQGTSGLEKRYDSILRGVPGTLIRARTPDGPRVVRDDPPTAGNDLTTELDMELQTLAEDSLNNWFKLAEELGTASDKMKAALAVGKGRAGFALIDCHTGAIIALASSPGYQLDDLRTRFDELLKTPGDPLLNHATMPDQPPGSAMKLCTALAGLEHGVLTPGEFIHSQGYMAMVRGQRSCAITRRREITTFRTPSRCRRTSISPSSPSAWAARNSPRSPAVSDSGARIRSMSAINAQASCRGRRPSRACGQPNHTGCRATTGAWASASSSPRRRCRSPGLPPRWPTAATSCSLTWSNPRPNRWCRI